MKNTLRMIAAMLAALMLFTAFPSEVTALSVDEPVKQEKNNVVGDAGNKNGDNTQKSEREKPLVKDTPEGVPLSDELINLLQRLSEFDSFTPEEKKLVEEHLLTTIEPQPESVQNYPEPILELYAIFARKDSLKDCDADERAMIASYIRNLSEAALLALGASGYSLRECYELSRVLQRGAFTLPQAKQILALYPESIDRESSLIVLDSFLAKEKSTKRQDRAKSLFLEGYDAGGIKLAFALGDILKLSPESLLMKTERNTNADKARAAAGLSGIDALFSKHSINVSAVQSAVAKHKLAGDDLMQALVEYNTALYGEDELQAKLKERMTPQSGPQVPPELPKPIIVDYEKSIYAPFEMSNSSNERVDLNTGNLNLDFGLVQIPGINGNDLDLRIRYNSTNAELNERSVGTGFQNYYVVLYDLPAWHQSGGAWIVAAERYSQFDLTKWFTSQSAAEEWIDDKDGDLEYGLLPADEHYVDWDFDDTIYASITWTNRVHEDGLTNPWVSLNRTQSNPAPASYFYDNGSYQGTLARGEARCIEATGFVHSPYPPDPSRQRWDSDSTWQVDFSGQAYRFMIVTQYKYKYVVWGLANLSYDYSFNTMQPLTYVEKNNNLGAGWSWNLPSIEASGDTKILHLGDGRSLSLKNDLSFKEYTLQDMKLESDSASYSNGQVSSAYVLKYKDGSKSYFGSDGRVLAGMDRFGNTIRYQHTTINGHPVVNKITDTAGRDVIIEYTDTTAGREVAVTSPDGTQTKLLLEAIPGYSGDYVLKEIVTPNQAQTSFAYSYDTAGFDFLSKAPTAMENVCANLTQVTYPTGAKSQYSYIKATDNLGEIGSYETYKLSSRKDVEGSSTYDTKTYTYTGTAGGYPTHNDSQNLPESFTYSVDVVDATGKTTTVTFNNKHLSISESIKDGTSPLYLKTQEYNADKLPTLITQRSYNSGGSYMESVLLYEYDSKGNITASWDKQALGNSADTEHKTVYTYDAVYSIPLTSTHKTDVSTTILQKNTLTVDGKAIRYAEVYENSVLKQKTEYLYDAFGNVTAERHYKDGFTDYIETTFSYADNVTGRGVDLSGVYLTSKTVKGVLDAEGVPVAGSPGNPAGTLTQGYIYDIMGQLTSTTDAAGNATAYQYDAMGRVLRITRSDGSHVGYEYDYTGNWMIVTNELGGQTEYDYDGFGNEIAIFDLDANQAIKTTVYDSSFRVLREDNHNYSADSAEISYTYDKLGRVTLKQTKNKAGVLLAQESYVYDNAAESGQYAKVTKTVKGDSFAPDMVTVAYTDYSGRLIKQGRVESGNEYLDTFVYDYVGNKLQEKTAIAHAEYSSVPYTSKWEYDYAGRVLKQYNALGDFATFTYDALGRLTSQTDYAGNAASQPYSTTFEYDSLGRKLRDIAPFEVSGGTVRYSEASYAYDQSGNLIRESHSAGLPGGAEQNRITEYTYDARNQLTGVILYPESGVPESTGYTYDAMGNKLTMTVGTATTTYAYDVHGRLLSLTDPLGQSESYTYDANGNLTSKTDRNGAVTAYVYDGLPCISGREFRARHKRQYCSILKTNASGLSVV